MTAISNSYHWPKAMIAVITLYLENYSGIESDDVDTAT